MPQPLIRLLTETDAADWRALRLQGLQTNPEAFGQTYDEAIAQPVAAVAERFTPDALQEVPVFGAFVDGALVGTCGLFREARAKQRHKATIWGMYVAPEARGLAIGRQLLTTAIAHARTMPGVLQLHLSVVTTNEVAARLYQRHGFVVYGHEKRALRFGGVDFDEDHMALVLDD